MERDLFFEKLILACLLFLQGVCFSQNIEAKPKSKLDNFGLGVRGLAFLSWYDDAMKTEGGLDIVDNKFDFNKDTKLIGANLLVHYYVYEGISIGFGTGIEEITQPKIKYVPAFVNLTLSSGRVGNGFHTEVDFGSHFGDLDKNGFMFRAGLGYRFRIHKQLFGYTSLIFTYQNLYKTFEESKKDNIYNFESAGLLIGFDLN